MTVAHLRMRGVPGDPLAARLRMDRILNETSLAPAALPPSAILCIRSLPDPVPGSLALRGDAPRATAAWTRALASAVAQMADRAVRPALGSVASDAPAIVFLDQAELLACLASDWCDGLLAQRWWWRSLFCHADLARLAADAWQERAGYVPAAFEQLSHGTRLLPFVRKLDAADVAGLLDCVAAVFGLVELRVELRSLLTGKGMPPQRNARDEVSPWSWRVPEASAPMLRLDERCLLGVSLMLQRAPAQARSPMFLQAVREWRRAWSSIGSVPVEAANPAGSAAPARDEMVGRERRAPAGGHGDAVSADLKAAAPPPKISSEKAPALSSRGQPGSGKQKLSVRNHLTTADAAHAPRVATAARSPEAPQQAGAAPGVGPLSSAPRRAVAGPVEQRAMSETADAVTADLEEAAPPSHVSGETRVDSHQSPFRQSPDSEDAFAVLSAVAPGPAAAPPRDESRPLPLTTRFGGLFYLINVGIFLELYGDFTAPAKPGIALSIWDFLAAVGERLVGEPLRADPVSPMLARLAGREDPEPPGRDFEPPQDWQMPDPWLDVPIDDARIPDSRLASPSPFDRWLDHLMVYLRARLALALRLPDAHAIGRVLIEHDARVFLTDSEIHVVLSLASLPLAIRLAGLDRDPGWVPAAGRRVAFQFE